MKKIERLFVACCLALATSVGSAFDFPKEWVFQPLHERRYSDKTADQIVDIVDQRLTPVLYQSLLPLMFDPWVEYTVSLESLLFELPHPTRPQAEPAVFGSRKLVTYHLKKIIEYCDEYFSLYVDTLDREQRADLMIDLHERFLERLQPRLEAEYNYFWENYYQASEVSVSI